MPEDEIRKLIDLPKETVDELILLSIKKRQSVKGYIEEVIIKHCNEEQIKNGK